MHALPLPLRPTSTSTSSSSGSSFNFSFLLFPSPSHSWGKIKRVTTAHSDRAFITTQLLQYNLNCLHIDSQPLLFKLYHSLFILQVKPNFNFLRELFHYIQQEIKHIHLPTSIQQQQQFLWPTFPISSKSPNLSREAFLFATLFSKYPFILVARNTRNSPFVNPQSNHLHHYITLHPRKKTSNTTVITMGFFEKLQSKLELYRLEKRYIRNRNRRSTFVSNAMYVDGEYVYQTPNATGSSTNSSSETPSEEPRRHSLDMRSTPEYSTQSSSQTEAQIPRKKLNRFSSMPGFGKGSRQEW